MAENEIFDPHKKEQQLRSEAAAWDTSKAVDASDGDIPTIDFSDYFETGSKAALKAVAGKVRDACEQVGFFSVIGHGVCREIIQRAFAATRSFHAQPRDAKMAIVMDQPDFAVGGVGYLPFKNRKLPARETGNQNEAFIVKCDHRIGMNDNLWPEPDALPSFRESVEEYAAVMVGLGKRMLPVYAAALDMPADFFDDAFTHPLYRLRMTHYPPVKSMPDAKFGISPHVDTTFCTILAQDSPGLTIYSEQQAYWLNVPLIENAFIVNTGELLRQWTNDRFISVKHFANNNMSGQSRYSIPFFFNANSHYKMACIPSCCGPDNPARYPAISYAESQASAQGE